MAVMNPNAPDTIGLEWFARQEGFTSLDAAAKGAAFLIDSSTAETIDGLYLPHQWVGPSSGYGRLWADVYELGDEAAGAEQSLSYAPNETKNSSGTTRDDFSSTSNLHTAIDDLDDSGPPEDTAYIVNSQYWTTGSYASFQFGTAAIASNLRILSVTLEVRCKGFDWSWQKPYIDLDWYNGTTRLGTLARITPPQDYVFRTYTFGPYYFDFFNEGPWLQPEIANLDVNTSRNLRLKLNYACAVSRVTLKVRAVPENRVAVGIGSKVTVPPSGVQTNAPISLKTPLNVDNWAKAGSGQDYLVVVRRAEDPFASLTAHTPQIAYLDGVTAPPADDGLDQGVTLGDTAGLVTALSASTTKAYAPTLGTSGGATSPDTQPYYDLVHQLAHTSSTLRQELGGASVQSYRRVRALIGIVGAPSDNLTFKVRRLSDNVQVGGNGALSISDLSNSAIATAAGTYAVGSTTVTLHEVQVTLASTATLAAATDYYVEITSGTPSTAPWYVFGLDTTAAHSLTTDRTYGGTTYTGVVAGVGDDSLDFMLTVASIPTAPANLTAVVQSIALPDNGDAICDPGSLEYVAIEWDATSVGASFGSYELERSSDASTWESVAVISTEATSFFNDFELARGVAYTYRVRVLRADGAFSDWTTSGSVTCQVTAGDGAVFFVSNSDPSIACGYVVATPDQNYAFPSAEETVFMRLHQRDYQVAFKPSEVRGAAWQFPLMVFQGASTNPPDGRGIRAFDTLRHVGEASIPYVCILTWNGERMFGAVQVPEGVQSEPAGLYVANVVVTQTQGEPSAVEV